MHGHSRLCTRFRLWNFHFFYSCKVTPHQARSCTSMHDFVCAHLTKLFSHALLCMITHNYAKCCTKAKKIYFNIIHAMYNFAWKCMIVHSHAYSCTKLRLIRCMMVHGCISLCTKMQHHAWLCTIHFSTGTYNISNNLHKFVRIFNCVTSNSCNCFLICTNFNKFM